MDAFCFTASIKLSTLVRATELPCRLTFDISVFLSFFYAYQIPDMKVNYRYIVSVYSLSGLGLGITDTMRYTDNDIDYITIL